MNSTTNKSNIQEYYVLADMVNLNLFPNRDKSFTVSYNTGIESGTQMTKTVSVPDYMRKRGDIIKFDLSTLDEAQLQSLCSLEIARGIVRTKTDYNKHKIATDLGRDLYKIIVNNSAQWVNTTYDQPTMMEFGDAEKTGAYILNPLYSHFYTQIIIDYYTDILKTK